MVLNHVLPLICHNCHDRITVKNLKKDQNHVWRQIIQKQIGYLFVICNVFEGRNMQDVYNQHILSVVGFTEKR